MPDPNNPPHRWKEPAFAGAIAGALVGAVVTIAGFFVQIELSRDEFFRSERQEVYTAVIAAELRLSDEEQALFDYVGTGYDPLHPATLKEIADRIRDGVTEMSTASSSLKLVGSPKTAEAAQRWTDTHSNFRWIAYRTYEIVSNGESLEPSWFNQERGFETEAERLDEQNFLNEAQADLFE